MASLGSPQSATSGEPSPSTTAKDDHDHTDNSHTSPGSPTPGPPTPPSTDATKGSSESGGPAVPSHPPASSPPFSPSPPAYSPAASPPPTDEEEDKTSPSHDARKKAQDVEPRTRRRSGSGAPHPSSSSSPIQETSPTQLHRRKRKRSYDLDVRSKEALAVSSSVAGPSKSPTATSPTTPGHVIVSLGGDEDALGDDMDLEEVIPEMLNGTSQPQDASSSTQETMDSGQSDADGETFSDEWMADMRRVKVYELVGQRWTDRGTALCTGVYDDEAEQASIVARSETSDLELLRSEIRPEDVYQRQQETLIVWTEPDGTDYALSFQDLEGCGEIWDFILEVQRHFRGKNEISHDINSVPNGSGSSGGGPSSPTSSRVDNRITANTIVQAGRLPEPGFGIIGEIDKAIKFIGRTAPGREKICEYLVREDYIKLLIDCFSQAEDLEELDDLHALCGLMQTILMMNDHPIYDYILQDDVWMGVLGMLEYDIEFPHYKAHFREYLTQSTQYKEVIVFNDDAIRKKIHQTYRLQFLKDVVLARVLDDPTFNVLNSFILFNQIDIINHIQHDETLLKQLFSTFEANDDEAEKAGTKNAAELSPKPDLKGKGKEKEAPLPEGGSPTSPEDQKRDILILIHQLCIMAKNIQIPARLTLYRSLVDRGLLHAITWGLLRYSQAQLGGPEHAKDIQVLNATAEILIVVCEHDANGVRSFALRQADPTLEWEKAAAGLSKPTAADPLGILPAAAPPETPEPSAKSTDTKARVMMKSTLPTVATAIVKVLTSAKDLALRAQMAEVLRLLLEVPVIEEPPPTVKTTPPKPLIQREDPIAERFLSYFYASCIDTMYQPLNEVPEFKNVNGPLYDISRDTAALFLYLCDNLTNWVLHHGHRSHYYVQESQIAKRVASLLKVREKYVKLAALRCLRVCSKVNNNFLLRHFVKIEIFGPILDMATRECKRDNLVSSACQEFFDGIRKDNQRLLISHIFEMYESQVRELCKAGPVAESFRGLLIRWEQNSQPMPPTPKLSLLGQERRMPGHFALGGLDQEEEDYWSRDDEDEDVLRDPTTPVLSLNINSQLGTIGNRRRRLNIGMGPHSPIAGVSQSSPRMAGGIVIPSPFPLNLVDYGNDGDESDEEDVDAEGEAVPSGKNAYESDNPESQVLPPVSSGLSAGLGGLGISKVTSFSHLKTSKSPNGTLNGAKSPPRLIEKRRREEEEEEPFGLLAKRKAGPSGKQPNVEVKPSPNDTKGTELASKTSPNVGGVAKKIKLSLGKTSFSLATTSSPAAKATQIGPNSPTPSETTPERELKTGSASTNG